MLGVFLCWKWTPIQLQRRSSKNIKNSIILWLIIFKMFDQFRWKQMCFSFKCKSKPLLGDVCPDLIQEFRLHMLATREFSEKNYSSEDSLIRYYTSDVQEWQGHFMYPTPITYKETLRVAVIDGASTSCIPLILRDSEVSLQDRLWSWPPDSGWGCAIIRMFPMHRLSRCRLQNCWVQSGVMSYDQRERKRGNISVKFCISTFSDF